MYPGHRRFLTTNHQCRKKGNHFKGEADHRKKPAMRTGDHVLAMVSDVHVIFGKGVGERSNFKNFLRTCKIMVMHSNERGECCPRTLVDRKRKR